MRDRLETIGFAIGLCAGIALACSTLALVLMHVAPAFKHIGRYSYSPSVKGAQSSLDVGTGVAEFNTHFVASATKNSFAPAHTVRVDRPSLGVSSQTEPRR